MSDTRLLDEAIYATAHAGRTDPERLQPKQLAAEIGLGYQTFINKVNETNTQHHLTTTELVRLMRVSGDLRPLHALAGLFDGVFVHLPAQIEPGLEFAEALANMSGEFGALMREVALDLADGRITTEEMARLDQAANQLRDALGVLQSQLRKLHRHSGALFLPAGATSN